MDRLRYELFFWLWRIWHTRLRHWFSGDRYHFCSEPRPWWHMCCNGNSGGWRTSLCDWLERKWRGTRYYCSPDGDS